MSVGSNPSAATKHRTSPLVENHVGIIEEKGIDVVLLSESHGSSRALFGLWMAANIEFGTLTTGALTTGAFGLSAGAAFLSILLANVIGGIIVALLGTMGVQYGLPQMIQGATWFGKIGNKLPSFLNFVCGFSWFAVNTVIGAYAIQYFLNIGLVASIVGLSIIQIAIAFIGHDFIQATEKYLFYMLTLIFLTLTVIAVHHLGLSVPANVKSMAAVGGFSGAFCLSTSIMVGYIAGWMPFASDYTRYLRTDVNQTEVKRTVFKYGFCGALISCVWIECLGALIGSSISFSTPADLFTSWMPVWFEGPLLFAVIIGTISANILNIYSAALSALAVGIKLKQHYVSLITGIVGMALSIFAATNFLSAYTNFLSIVGYWVMPWTVILLVGHFTRRVERFKGVSAGLVSWLLAIVLSEPFWNQALHTGWFATQYPQFGDLTLAVASLLAGSFYLILTRPQTVSVSVAVAELVLPK